MRRGPLFAVPSALILGLVLAAQAGPAPQAAPATGTVRFALVGAIETLDPAKASSEAARTCVGNLFDQLYEYAHVDGTPRLVPALAASLPSVSEDGLTQTIQLRKNVSYVDDPCFPRARGREVRAGDVVFCIKRLMDAHTESPNRGLLQRRIRGLDGFSLSSRKPPRNPTRSAYRTTEGYAKVPGLEVVDDHTLRFHLLEPMPAFAWLLASTPLSIYPPEAVRHYGPAFGKRAVGTGPYRLLIRDGVRGLTLRRNPRYRIDLSPPDGRGLRHRLPRNDTVVVRAFDDPRVAWSAFLAGEVDCAEVARDAFAATIDPSTGKLLPHLAKRGVQLHRQPRLEIFYDAFNMQDPILGAPAGERGLALRTAICLATDDVWTMARVYAHRAERVFGPLLPELAGYDVAFTNPTLPGEGETREEALVEARTVLREAGLTDTSTIPPLKMHILPDATSRRMFDIFRRQVADLGLRVTSVPLPWPRMREALRKGQAQIWTSSWRADYPDAENFLQCFFSHNIPEPNTARFHSAEFDEAYTEARGTKPGPEREELLREMQDIAVEACVWRYRFRRIRWTATQHGMTGFRTNDMCPKYFKHCTLVQPAAVPPKK